MLHTIGYICKEFRIKHDLKVYDIAFRHKCTTGNIYLFEKGKINNLLILSTYYKMIYEKDRNSAEEFINLICKTWRML